MAKIFYISQKRTCGECPALEGVNEHRYFCALQFAVDTKTVKSPKSLGGFKTYTEPLEPCPKPRSIKQYIEMALAKDKEYIQKPRR